MKAMQDKDFDRLFADALGDLEEIPSEKVWAGIAKRQKQPSQHLFRRLSVAASLLLMFSVGLWYYAHREKPAENIAQKTPAKRVRPAQPNEWHQQALTEELSTEKQFAAKSQAPAIAQPASFTTKKNQPQKKHRVAGKEETEFKETFPAQAEEPVLASVQPKERSFLKAAEPVHAASVLHEAGKITVKSIEIPIEKKHKNYRLRSLGDLVNLVVAKVDKREEKIIEFSDEDGQSTVTGLNLGIISIKKGKQQ